MSGSEPSDVWAVVPAAGMGRRLDDALPKQYMEVAGRSILDHSLRALLAHPRVRGAVVAVAPDEHPWEPAERSPHKAVYSVEGGRERADSVLAGLRALSDMVAPHVWILVHDAARPCLSAIELDRLITTVADDPVGGILAVPVADTLKRCSEDGVIQQTVNRSGLWQAQTPQMFRLGMLQDVLTEALRAGVAVTDESSAMEWGGHRPRVVPGSRTNLKVTQREDLLLVEALLRQRGEDG